MFFVVFVQTKRPVFGMMHYPVSSAFCLEGTAPSWPHARPARKRAEGFGNRLLVLEKESQVQCRFLCFFIYYLFWCFHCYKYCFCCCCFLQLLIFFLCFNVVCFLCVFLLFVSLGLSNKPHHQKLVEHIQGFAV